MAGRALRGIDRDDYVLATKVYFPMDTGPNDRGLSRQQPLRPLRLSTSLGAPIAWGAAGLRSPRSTLLLSATAYRANRRTC